MKNKKYSTEISLNKNFNHLNQALEESKSEQNEDYITDNNDSLSSENEDFGTEIKLIGENEVSELEYKKLSELLINAGPKTLILADIESTAVDGLYTKEIKGKFNKSFVNIINHSLDNKSTFAFHSIVGPLEKEVFWENAKLIKDNVYHQIGDALIKYNLSDNSLGKLHTVCHLSEREGLAWYLKELDPNANNLNLTNEQIFRLKECEEFFTHLKLQYLKLQLQDSVNYADDGMKILAKQCVTEQGTMNKQLGMLMNLSLMHILEDKRFEEVMFFDNDLSYHKSINNNFLKLLYLLPDDICPKRIICVNNKAGLDIQDNGQEPSGKVDFEILWNEVEKNKLNLAIIKNNEEVKNSLAMNNPNSKILITDVKPLEKSKETTLNID